MRSKKKKRALSGLLVAAMLTSMLNTTSVFSSSDVDAEPQEAETVVTTEAPAPETQAPTEETAPVTEAQTQAAAEATEAPESDAAATEQTTDGQTGTEAVTAEATEATTDTEKPTEKETETETEKEVRKNKVTFQVDDGALVTIKDIDITKDTKEAHEASQAIDGKIVFKVVAKDGYEITKVRVDDEADARKNEETKDEPDDYIIEGILTDNTVVKVEAKRIEKEVTVTYEAEDGGQVTNAKETINLGDEDVNFIGSTAQSGKDLLFTSWKDEDGEVVSNNAEFTPSVDEVTEDVTYTANFIEKDQVPAQDFEKTEDVNGLTVKVEAKKGIFPKDTTMTVEAVSEKVALDIAQKAADEDKEVTAAVGVNITFRDADGKEIEPINAQAVKVKISLNSPLEGENFSVIHQADDDNVTKVADANADGASFEANSFSIYVVEGEKKPAIATYTFHDVNADGTESILSVKLKDQDGQELDEPVESQKVKSGETVYVPKTPERDGQIFMGWAYASDKSKAVITSNKEFRPTVEETGDVDLYAVYQEAHYVFFMDNNNRVCLTKVKKPGEPVLTAGVSFPLPSNKAVTGWYRSLSDAQSGAGKVDRVDEDVDVTLYPRVDEGHYLVFSTGGDGASYIAPQFVVANEGTEAPDAPTKPGYEFAGWATTENGTDTFTFGNTISEQTTIYAKWKPREDTPYTIIFWKQAITDKKDAADSAKTYDYAESITTETGRTGDSVSISVRNGNLYLNVGSSSKRLSGKESYSNYTFNANNSKSVTINGDGSTVLNVYYDRNLLTITFDQLTKYTATEDSYNRTPTQYGVVNNQYIRLYHDQYGWYYINNRTYYDYNGTRYKQTTDRNVKYTGLYGQTLKQNGYDWPSSSGWKYVGKSTGLTFLDAFIFDDLAGANREKTEISLEHSATTNKTISHYREGLKNGDYGTPFTVYATYTGNYDVTEKFTGFYVTEKRTSSNGEWKKTYVGDSISFNNSLHLRYKRLSYDLAFSNNGSVIDSLTKPVLYEAPLADYAKVKLNDDYRPAGLTKAYHFAGWYKDPQGTIPFEFDKTTMPAAGVIVYAKWAPDQHTVTAHTITVGAEGTDNPINWEVDDGGVVDASKLPTVVQMKDDKEVILHAGDNSNKIIIPKNADWAGWSTLNEDGTYTKYNLDDSEKVFDNVALYPYWISTEKYKVTYVVDGDTTIVTDNTDYAAGSDAEVKSAGGINPTGKVFLHWAEMDADGNVKNTYYPQDKVRITGNVTLYAVFGDEGKITTLTYHSNYPADALPAKEPKTVAHKFADDEDHVSDEQGRNNVEVTLKDAAALGFTAGGYKFVGWAKTATAKAKEFNPTQDNIGLDNTSPNDLYAVWEPQDVKVKITKLVTGNMGDKSKPFDFTYTVDRSRKDDKDQTTTSGTFQLSDGEDTTITIPLGSKIVVEEKVVDGYTTSYSYGNATTANDRKLTITTVDKDTEVTFTNDRNVTAPTGIGLNSTTPLLLILSAILLFFASFFYVRRNRVEEL